MIQVICENGYADDIMAAARKEGAKGGTILKGHGTAKENVGKLRKNRKKRVYKLRNI